MRIKDIQDENFQDYKKISMFICTIYCSGKCWKELKLPPDVCQNNCLARQKTYDIADGKIVERYVNNPITSAIVIGGLEPFDQFHELYSLITALREKTNDDIVVYSGFYPEEISSQIEQLKQFPNIIIKFGRYIPNRPSRYDEVLGVTLVSDNQFAKKIS